MLQIQDDGSSIAIGSVNSRLGLGQRNLADNRNFLARNPVVIKTDPLILAC
jgi:hypothetical protein